MAADENAPGVGMVPAVRSSLDVAIWFYDRANSANRQLDVLTLQQFLYLAQTEFAKNNNGRKLLPATFLATNTGPLEPTVYHVFERGRPNLRNSEMSFEISRFLMEIWDKYEARSGPDLTRLVNNDLHYRHAFDQGRNHEISITALRVVPEPPAPAPAPEPQPETPVKEAQDQNPREDNFVGFTSSGKRATKWTPPGRADHMFPEDEADS